MNAPSTKSAFATMIALAALLCVGWAHAAPKPVCTVTERLVTTPEGSQHIVRKVVCVVGGSR